MSSKDLTETATEAASQAVAKTEGIVEQIKDGE